MVNKLNNLSLQVSDIVIVPPSVKRQLQSWITAVQGSWQPLDFSPRVRFTLFVDASLQGWGAVMVDMQTQEISVLGERWQPNLQGKHINVLEAVALQKAVCLLPSGIRDCRLDIWVDNTTVQSVARKKMCGADKDLNDAVVEAVNDLSQRRIATSIQWISTKYNPADLPSRVLVPLDQGNRDELVLAVWRFLTGAVGGGSVASHPRPTNHLPLRASVS